MGDRNNIILEYSNGGKIWLYSHWTGSNLSKVLKSALIRGKERWSNEAYLARIIFSEMIKEDVMELTGYGISTYQGDQDCGNKILNVNLDNNTVNNIPFEKFIKPKIPGNKSNH